MFHGPLTTIAAFPALNWSIASPCPQLTTEREAEPSCRSWDQNSAAPATSGVARSFSSPPLDHMNGMNWNVPS
jgi:hypothetical protein